MRAVGTELRLAENGGTGPGGGQRYWLRVAIAAAVATLFACAAPPPPGLSRAQRNLEAGLELYDSGEYNLAAARFREASRQAQALRQPDVSRRALAASCVSWLRARALVRFASCTESLERMQSRARRIEPGVGALLALGAIAGERKLPEYRVDPAVYRVIRNAALDGGGQLMHATTRRCATASVALGWLLATSGAAYAVSARERAVEEIPELMSRILESQEQIREQENELAPRVEGYNAKLQDSRREIDDASTDADAVEALIDYVEAYSSRLEAQQDGLRAIEGPVVRMRADARELARASVAAESGREAPEVRERFYQDQFQGVATATRELAARLGRENEASTAGSVLHAGWASHDALDVPVPELGPDGAVAFARKIEGLYATHQARSNQLRAERQAVRRLLDLLIERQLARRLDQLFAGSDGGILGEVLSGDGKSEDWGDLNRVVARALDIPAAAGGLGRSNPSLDRLDYFARGAHRHKE